MKKWFRVTTEWLSLVLIMLASPLLATAAGSVTPPSPATPNGLSFAQLKVTGDEFLVLQNNTDQAINDLSSYWLYDFNNLSPLASGVSGSQQQLPAVTLDAGQALLLSSTTRNTCGAEVAGKLTVSLTDGGGFLQLVRLTQDENGAVQQTSGDVVSWSSGASGIIPNVPSSSKDPAALYYRYLTEHGSAWQLADLDSKNACQLDALIGGTSTPAPTGGLKGGTAVPPAIIVSLAADATGSDAPTLPPGDIGLSAPVVNELLPNPPGTGNDTTDEFIELYNPNSKSFDLSGFVLETGVVTKHKYTLPADTLLAPKSFRAFFSGDTGLSLSNSGSQAALLDPFGNLLNQSDGYGTAKDGAAWALANGVWYFTSDPTPNAANVIKQASTSKSGKSSKSNSVKGASTTGTSGPNSGSSASSQTADVTPVHPWTLAIVAALAVAYGVYEYRLDLANRFYEYRKHRAARSKRRYAVQGR